MSNKEIFTIKHIWAIITGAVFLISTTFGVVTFVKIEPLKDQIELMKIYIEVQKNLEDILDRQKDQPDMVQSTPEIKDETQKKYRVEKVEEIRRSRIEAYGLSIEVLNELIAEAADLSGLDYTERTNYVQYKAWAEKANTVIRNSRILLDADFPQEAPKYFSEIKEKEATTQADFPVIPTKINEMKNYLETLGRLLNSKFPT